MHKNSIAVRLMIMVAGLLTSVSALSATIDFDNNISQPSPFVYESEGFRFTNGQIISASLDGTNYLAVGDPGCGGCIPLEISMETISGAAFNLSSADVLVGSSLPSASIIGSYAGGGTVIRSITTDGWDSQIFGLDWEGLTSVTFTMSSASGVDIFGIDNVSASVVPVPAAVWLFASALAGLGWIRRTKASATH